MVTALAARTMGWGIVGYGWVARDYAAPAILAAILLVAGAGPGSSAVLNRLIRHTAAFAGLSAAAFGGAWAATSPLSSAALAALCAACLGGAAYVAGLTVVARREIGVLLGAVAARRGTAG